MPPAPGYLVAAAMGILGASLLAGAVLAGGDAPLRSVGGVGLLVLAMLVSGAQVLTRHGAPTKGAA